MEMPQIDRSNYLKGLLITAKKDKQLTESEKKILKNISYKLGFSSDFYNEITENLLSNEYITEEPIKFSEKKIAQSFIEDGLKLALSDRELSDSELSWLMNTANVNDIEKKWVIEKSKELKKNYSFLAI
jgi:uncharacterized tellurite resistance protein B-like protein